MNNSTHFKDIKIRLEKADEAMKIFKNAHPMHLNPTGWTDTNEGNTRTIMYNFFNQDNSNYLLVLAESAADQISKVNDLMRKLTEAKFGSPKPFYDYNTLHNMEYRLIHAFVTRSKHQERERMNNQISENLILEIKRAPLAISASKPGEVAGVFGDQYIGNVSIHPEVSIVDEITGEEWDFEKTAINAIAGLRKFIEIYELQ